MPPVKKVTGFVYVRAFTAVFFLAFTCGSFAYERIEGVYEAVVEIQDRSDVSRNQAFSEGLEQVLVRYTGYSRVAAFPELVSELNSAQNYVIEFGLETSWQESQDGLGIEQGDSLWIRYNAGLVDELAATYELPIWPTLRPTISYVVVNELWGKPHLPAPSDRPALFLHLDNLFHMRGLNAKPLPQGFITGIGAQQIWDLNEQTAMDLRAHASNAADVVAVIRLQELQDTVKARFLFLGVGTETLIQKQTDSLNTAMDHGINGYVDQLSTDLAFLGGASVELELFIMVENVRDYGRYRRILDQIAGLEQVNSVRMDRATDEGISYVITYQSDRELLIDSLEAVTGMVSMEVIPSREDIATNQPFIPGAAENPIRFITL